MGNQAIPLDPASLLESSLPLIEGVVAEVARRYRVRGDALEEFRSLAFLKLVEHDYAVLRRFEGASSLRTYLMVVLQRVLLDYRNREWGRWRASATASRLGPEAVALERMVTRDGLTPDEALASLGRHAERPVCGEFVASLRRRAPARGTRWTLGEDAIPDCCDPAPGPEARMSQRELGERATAVGGALRAALHSLSSQDHLLVTLRFRDGLPIADVARVMEVDAKPLYRRLDRILAHLREVLCENEVRGELARELARDAWSDLAAPGESWWSRPSNPLNGPALTVSHVARRGMSRRRPAGRLHRRPAQRAQRRSGTALM